MKTLMTFIGLTLLLGTAANAEQHGARKGSAHRKISSKDVCKVDLGDPQFSNGVMGICCTSKGGTINDNKDGHPPITICEGGKYDGYYVGGEDDKCLVDMGDPKFSPGVTPQCCKGKGGKINDNPDGHPPVTLCEGGKYGGYYVGSGE